MKRVEHLVEAEPARERVGPLEAVDHAAERVERAADRDQRRRDADADAEPSAPSKNAGKKKTAAQPSAM